MPAQPTGMVTLVFTDIEGSTRLLERLGQESYAEALDRHRRLLRASFARHGGFEVNYEGDSFFVAFADAEEAVAAAAESQLALAAAEWPDGCEMRVRIGIHTGEPMVAAPKYVGLDVHRAARIMSAGHGGQVLLSQTTRELVKPDVSVRDLGEHRLKDLGRPERLWQLGDHEFPPLRSLHRAHLPVAAWPLLGREKELAQLRDWIAAGARLATLTGPGGSGKTRLAVQAAAELVDVFPEGVYFVPLAPVREAASVAGAVAQALGLSPDDDLPVHLASGRRLLVLDNAEQIESGAEAVGDLLVGETVVLVTSRAPLHLSYERELAVDPLADEAAVELFTLRAAAAGRTVVADDDVAAVCRRLDNLPLALELAAARTKLLAPSALLGRLEHALPILSSGAADLPERQRTLRATIGWSYELLGEHEQAAFRRLAVCRGGFFLDCAEKVAGADLDLIASLVDQSLLRPVGEERFQMLETIREFALEQLEQAGERAATESSHACFYLDRLEALQADLRGPRHREILAWYQDEADNTWAALEAFLAAGEADLAWKLADLLGPYWVACGRMRDGARWLQTALSLAPARSMKRGRALTRLGDLLQRIGRNDESEAPLREALAIGEETGDEAGLARALTDLAYLEADRQSDDALPLARAAHEHASNTGDQNLIDVTRMPLSNALIDQGHMDEAEALILESLEFRTGIGDAINSAYMLINLATLAYRRQDWDRARSGYRQGNDALRAAGHPAYWIAEYRIGLLSYLAEHDPSTALPLLVGALDFAASAESEDGLTSCAQAIALVAAGVDVVAAADLVDAADALRADLGLKVNPADEAILEPLRTSLHSHAGTEPSQTATKVRITLEDAVARARDLAARARGL